jgi:hypothetical protein
MPGTSRSREWPHDTQKQINCHSNVNSRGHGKTYGACTPTTEFTALPATRARHGRDCWAEGNAQRAVHPHRHAVNYGIPAVAAGATDTGSGEGEMKIALLRFDLLVLIVEIIIAIFVSSLIYARSDSNSESIIDYKARATENRSKKNNLIFDHYKIHATAINKKYFEQYLQQYRVKSHIINDSQMNFYVVEYGELSPNYLYVNIDKVQMAHRLRNRELIFYSAGLSKVYFDDYYGRNGLVTRQRLKVSDQLLSAAWINPIKNIDQEKIIEYFPGYKYQSGYYTEALEFAKNIAKGNDLILSDGIVADVSKKSNKIEFVVVCFIFDEQIPFVRKYLIRQCFERAHFLIR